MVNSKTIKVLAALAVLVAAPLNIASAMHISEGFLPPVWCISWAAISVPFLIKGFFVIKRKCENSPRMLLLLSMCAAFAFVLSALKMPSVTGSSAHPTGVGLGAILFGPFAMSVVGLIILLFQALLLAHGGLTTIGANVFSMGIVGPFAAYIVYKLLRKAGAKPAICVFFAAFAGDLSAYIATSAQLALAFYNEGNTFGFAFTKFLGIFAITQIPIAISEGLLTVAVYEGLKKYSRREVEELENA